MYLILKKIKDSRRTAIITNIKGVFYLFTGTQHQNKLAFDDCDITDSLYPTITQTCLQRQTRTIDGTIMHLVKLKDHTLQTRNNTLFLICK